jgi:hypothetical protein
MKKFYLRSQYTEFLEEYPGVDLTHLSFQLFNRHFAPFFSGIAARESYCNEYVQAAEQMNGMMINRVTEKESRYETKRSHYEVS